MKDNMNSMWEKRSWSESVEDKVLRRALRRYELLLNAYATMRETFMYEQYSWLVSAIRPKTIAIDIGASIGDTAIYLAKQKGIEKTVGFEPDERRFKEALANVQLSRINNIELHNRPANLEVLNSVLRGDRKYIIKCDCEGAEHELFTSKTKLKNVYRVQIEYHDGVKELPETLESAGFVVKVEKPWTSKDVGWIKAHKVA